MAANETSGRAEELLGGTPTEYSGKIRRRYQPLNRYEIIECVTRNRDALDRLGTK